MDGQTGRARLRLMGVVRWLPRTLAKRRTVTLVAGLSSEKSRTSASASTSARSTLFLTGLVLTVSSWNVLGSLAADPYTNVEDFTTMWRTDEPAAPAAAKRFIVPITLISCMARRGTAVEFVIMNVCRMVSTWVAFTIRFRME